MLIGKTVQSRGRQQPARRHRRGSQLRSRGSVSTRRIERRSQPARCQAGRSEARRGLPTYPARLAQAAFAGRRRPTATPRLTFRGWAGPTASASQSRSSGSRQTLLKQAAVRALLVWYDGRLVGARGPACDAGKSHCISRARPDGRCADSGGGQCARGRHAPRASSQRCRCGRCVHGPQRTTPQ